MADPFGTLNALRAQVAELLGDIDMAELPQPTRVRHASRKSGPEMEVEPGATWDPAHTVKVFTIDTEESRGAVFVTDIRWGYAHPSEWEAFTPEDARRFGMALLAAADWADKHRPEMPRLENVKPLKPRKQSSR